MPKPQTSPGSSAEHPRDLQSLALTDREADPVLADFSVQPIGKAFERSAKARRKSGVSSLSESRLSFVAHDYPSGTAFGSKPPGANARSAPTAGMRPTVARVVNDRLHIRPSVDVWPQAQRCQPGSRSKRCNAARR